MNKLNSLRIKMPFQEEELQLYPNHPIWYRTNISLNHRFQLRHYLEYGKPIKSDELLTILYGEWNDMTIDNPTEFNNICSLIKKVFPPSAYGSKDAVKKWLESGYKYNWMISSPCTPPEIEAFVYIWFDGINRKFYIGSHKGNPYTSTYTHSSKMMRTFKASGVPYYFKRKVLATGTEDAIAWAETFFLLDRKVPLNTKYHNKIITDPDSRLDQRRGMKNSAHKFTGRKRRMSREQIEAIKSEFETSDITKVKLAEKWGISRAGLYRIASLKLDDLFDETKFLPYENKGRVSYYDDVKGIINEMVDKGITKAKIAETLGIGESTVYKYIKQINQAEEPL